MRSTYYSNICSLRFRGFTQRIVIIPLMNQETSPAQFEEVHQSGIFQALCTFIGLYTLATGTWTLATYLPLIISDKVPEEDEKWECFLLLLDILRICTSRPMSKECANYLSGLILDHHQHFLASPQNFTIWCILENKF